MGKDIREEHENRKEGDILCGQSKHSIRKEVRRAAVLPRARTRVGSKEEPWEIGVPYWHPAALAVLVLGFSGCIYASREGSQF